jgi:hypothetical protein
MRAQNEGNSMSTTSNAIKTVGKSGQISLGKSYAGKTLRMRRQPAGEEKRHL